VRTYHENYVQAVFAVNFTLQKMYIGAPNNLGMAAGKAYLLQPSFDNANSGSAPVAALRGISPFPGGNLIAGVALSVVGHAAKAQLKNQREQDENYRAQLIRSGTFSSNEVKELWIAETARLAIQSGVGNCAEQAAITFIYLRDKGIFPIEIAYWGNLFGHQGSHSFVILDRSKDSDIRDPNTWGESCVVCDPQMTGLAFPASMATCYFGIKQFEIEFRMDAPSSVKQ